LSSFESRIDGEYRQCARCAHLGYGPDSWHPATREYWPVARGRIWFGRCLACNGELAARKFGVVPAADRLVAVAA
jgi:hypothetical protein